MPMLPLLAKILADALAPGLARWSERREHTILRSGIPLSPELVAFASHLGILEPEDLRLELVEKVPLPVPDALATLASLLGLPVFPPAGMCLGRGISSRSDDQGLLRHELVHTLQYQRLGGHPAFMWRYVFECLRYGYAAAPLEIEASQGIVDGSRPS